MGGLFHTLNIGAESLFASRQGVDTAGHNIANAQTEGFSRQRVELEARAPSETRGVLIGNGVFVKNITRAHDQFLEKQINDAHQSNGHSQARFDAMKALEGIYSPELNNTLSNELDHFFSSLHDLSNFPDELTVRAAVRENAQNVVASFKHIDGSLKTARTELNDRIAGEVSEASGLLEQIARLNVAIKAAQTTDNKDVNDLMDQQDKMLRELTQKLDINYYRGDQGLVVVRGPRETILVERGTAARLDVRKIPEDGNMYDLVVEGGASTEPVIVTKANKSGRIAGMMEVRDKVVPGLLDRNDQMAYSLASSINDAHRQGFGLKNYKDTTGRDFFSIGGESAGSAMTISLDDRIIESTDAISAAVSPNAPGDNVIVNNMLRVQERKTMDDGRATLQDYYANYVGVFGLDLVRTEQVKDADDTLVKNLHARRDSVSGVSMDEEATNLLKWQANFTASSKVITTIDEMIETVLSMKR